MNVRYDERTKNYVVSTRLTQDDAEAGTLLLKVPAELIREAYWHPNANDACTVQELKVAQEAIGRFQRAYDLLVERVNQIEASHGALQRRLGSVELSHDSLKRRVQLQEIAFLKDEKAKASEHR